MFHANRNPSRIQKSQFLKSAIRENTIEVPTTAPEAGRENAAPASGEGAGAIPLSWAETVENMATMRTNTKALAMMLTCAIALKDLIDGSEWLARHLGLFLL